MKQLYYALINLLRGKSSNIIKIISLTLGLTVGILMFARIAYELSFNKGYKEPEKLAIILAAYNVEGLSKEPMSVIQGPIPRTLMADFPEEVEVATLTKYLGSAALYVGEQRFVANAMMADEHFFETFGITVTSGSPMELAVSNMVFVSEDFAKRTFGTTNVMGNTYMYDRSQEYTIRGTYIPVEENNSVKPDVVISIAGWPYRMGWDGGGSFEGYARLRHPADLDIINKRMDTIIEQYMPSDPEKDGFEIKYSLQNMREEFLKNPTRQRMIIVLGFLAFALLLIAAMNYILIAISGLSRRAKGVGVHKCNGATSGQVLHMFLLETGIIILASVLLAVLLIINLRGIIEDVLAVKISSLFTLQTLWVPFIIIVLVFLAAGVIPGKIFSGIPVTQVFRKYTERNSAWKKILLAIQFTGVALVFGLLAVIYIQYERIMNHDSGYRMENIAVGSVWLTDISHVQSTIKNLPMVESVSLSELGIGDGWSGYMVKDENGNDVFSARYNAITPEYVPLYGMTISEGRNVMTPGEVLVNKEYVRRMRWKDSALGKESSSENSLGRIVGIVDDFVEQSLYVEKRPVVLAYNTGNQYMSISVKLREPFEASLKNLNEEIITLFPSNDLIFISFEEEIAGMYDSVKRFRSSAIIAFVAILFITFMGLFGYINDEMQRRTKEIAIRKINGSESWGIMILLSREIALVAFPSILVGLVISYFIGKEWLLQFATTLVVPHLPLYILLCILLVLIVIISVIIKTWRIANENPVISLRSE